MKDVANSDGKDDKNNETKAEPLTEAPPKIKPIEQLSTGTLYIDIQNDTSPTDSLSANFFRTFKRD